MSNVLPFKKQASMFAGGEPPDNGDMAQRISKLEAYIERTHESVRDLRADVASLRTDLKADIRDSHTEFKSEMRDMRRDMTTDFRVTFAAIITVALGLAGLMAKGFGWL